MNRLGSFVLVWLVLMSSAHAQVAELQDQTPTKVEDFAEDTSQMSLETKIGQLIILGFPGKKLTPALEKRIKAIRPGGIIIFGRNIGSLKQIEYLNKSIQKSVYKACDINPFTMVDQEGGSVSRLRLKPEPPSALAMGGHDDLELTEEVGALTGKALSLLGFNMNLAPVADISDPYKSNFIGNRSFGADPDFVATKSQAFARGLIEFGILPTFKHYPGHGGIGGDSHKMVPKKVVLLEELKKHDLIPFKKFATEKTPSAIMIAHVSFPNIDPSGLPATFSKILINDLLIEEWKYSGLIITDDLEMTGASGVESSGERAVKALEAGVDMVMFASSEQKQREAFTAILKAVKDGRLSEERINSSFHKIISLKRDLAKKSMWLRKSKRQREQLLSSTLADLKKSTSKVSQKNLQIGLSRAKFNASEFAKSAALVFSPDPDFFNKFKTVYKQKTDFLFLSPNKEIRRDAIITQMEDLLGVFYVTGRGSARLLDSLPEEVKGKLLVINSGHPGLIQNSQLFLDVIHVYSRNSDLGTWLAEYLNIAPEPRIPASATTEDTDPTI